MLPNALQLDILFNIVFNARYTSLSTLLGTLFGKDIQRNNHKKPVGGIQTLDHWITWRALNCCAITAALIVQQCSLSSCLLASPWLHQLKRASNGKYSQSLPCLFDTQEPEHSVVP